MDASRQFRRLLRSKDYLFTVGVYSPLQAKLAERVGLESVYISGYSVSLGYLGKADLGWITMTEMSTVARYVKEAVSVPVIVDCDDGYGNPMITIRTVQEFENVGVAGIHIEDQKAPKRCGHLVGKEVLPLEDSVNKIRAAVSAKRDPNFVIIARTDARGAVGGSLDEAIRRGVAYAQAGADMIFCEFDSPDDVDEFKKFSDSIHKEYSDLPLMYNYSSSFKWSRSKHRLTFKEIADMGYKFIIVSMGAIHAEMYSVWNFLDRLKRTEQDAQFEQEHILEGHPTQDHHKVGDLEQFKKWEEEYLPLESLRTKYGDNKKA